MKGVIPTPDIAKKFHPTPDIKAKNARHRHSKFTPTLDTHLSKDGKIQKKTFPCGNQNLLCLWHNFLFGIVLIQNVRAFGATFSFSIFLTICLLVTVCQPLRYVTNIVIYVTQWGLVDGEHHTQVVTGGWCTQCGLGAQTGIDSYCTFSTWQSRAPYIKRFIPPHYIEFSVSSEKNLLEEYPYLSSQLLMSFSVEIRHFPHSNL